MKKRIACFRILLTLSWLSLASAFASAQSLTLVMYPLDAGNDPSNSAGLIEDLLRVELINSNQAIVVDRVVVERTLSKLGVLATADSSADDALLNAARELDADLYLKGSLATQGQSTLLLLELVAVNRGLSLYSKPTELGTDNKKLIRIVAKELIDSMTVLQGVSLQDVQALIELGQFREARKLLDRYSVLKSSDARIPAVADVITKGLADDAYRKAEEMRRLFLYDDALVEINRAISFDPDNLLYTKAVESIQRDKQEFNNEKLDAVMLACDKLVQERHFKVANKLLEALFQGGADSVKVQELSQAIRSGLAEEDHVQKANTAFFRQDYTEARLELREAIILNPDNPEYAWFMDTIDQREAQARQSRLRWDAYRGQLFSFDPVELFLDKKRLQGGLDLGLFSGSWTYRDRDSLAEATFTLAGIQGGYGWERLLPVLRNLAYTDTYAGYGFGARLGTGTDEAEGALVAGYRDLTARRVVMAQVFGTGTLDFVAFSFLFSPGLEAGMGLNFDQRYQRSPASGDETTTVDVAYTLHGGVSVGMAWVYTERFRLGLDWSGQGLLMFPDYGHESFGLSMLTLSASFRR